MNADYLGFETKTKINTPEINHFVDFCKTEKRFEEPTIVSHILTIKFSKELEEIDELFYSYLLLFKQIYSLLEFKLHFPSEMKNNKIKEIANQYVAYLNANYDSFDYFVSIDGLKPSIKEVETT